MEYGPGNSPLKTVTYPGRTFGRKPSCLLANRRTQKQPLAAKSRRQDDHKPTNVNIELIVIGKTDSKEIESLLAMYARRINFYCRFAVTVLPDVKNTKNLSAKQQRTTEGASLLRQFGDGDYVVLLDERGDEYRSIDFAYWLQKRMASGIRRLVMVIGGPYGFSDEVYARADTKLSLSKMTFSHQIVRAIFAEQIYRAFTILNNEPYHHE